VHNKGQKKVTKICTGLFTIKRNTGDEKADIAPPEEADWRDENAS
jgi:hypothetical protein